MLTIRADVCLDIDGCVCAPTLSLSLPPVAKISGDTDTRPQEQDDFFFRFRWRLCIFNMVSANLHVALLPNNAASQS